MVKFYEKALNTRMGRLIIPPINQKNESPKELPKFDPTPFLKSYGGDDESEQINSNSESRVIEIVKNGLNGILNFFFFLIIF